MDCGNGLRYPLAADAEVDGDVDALLAAVVGDRQALEPPTVDQAVADEVQVDSPGFTGRIESVPGTLYR
jgi:hypothetical protein